MENLEIKDKKIIVTGGAGFIGSHLVKKLLERKANVIVVDIAIDPRSFFAKEKLKEKAIYKKIDIRNRKLIFKLFRDYVPDYIFHLAAEPIVTSSYENPYDTFMTNVIGTVNMLDAALKSRQTKAIIIASSDKAYGKTKKPYTEEFPLKGDHPYDVSKSCTDLISQTYYKTYGLPVIITRFGNVYGEGDIHFDRIIPGICKSILEDKTLDIRSDGSYVRDFVYIPDVVSAYIFLLNNHKKIKGEAFNIASDVTLSVLEIVNKCKEILKKDLRYTIKNSSKNEIPYQHLIDKKIRKIGWRQSFTLEEGLRNTFLWYKKNIFS